jgi:hypothetical protein
MRKYPVRVLVVALAAAWVGILLTAGDSPAQLYRYVDKNGKVVITDNPPPGVAADVVEKGKEPLPPPAQPAEPKATAPPAKDSPSVGKDGQPLPPRVAEQVDREAEKAAKEEAEKETNRIMAEEAARKQAEKQLRLEEAERLEKEAKQPIVPTQENIDRQRKLMEEAQRLREMP